MRNIILLFVGLIVFSCTSTSEVKENNKIEKKVIRNGIDYWASQEDGWHNSPGFNTLVKDGKVVEQYVYNVPTNDTIFKFSNFKGKRNLLNGTILTIFIESEDEDTLKKKEIRFDPKFKKLSFYKGPLDFLTKKDSMDLDKSYPDWKEQIKAWEAKHKD